MAALEYQFADPQLLLLALRHRSLGDANNERLEFLGDAVLGLVISNALYRRLPQAPESLLSQRRSALVRREMLATLARELNLERFITLGPSARRSGVGQRESVLADCLEALIGAVFLDAGEPTARALIERLFASRLGELDQLEIKDPKTRLQEAMQARGWPLPSYSVTATTGALHQQTFTVRCELVEPAVEAEGGGGSRREAEKAAAAVILALLAERGTIAADE